MVQKKSGKSGVRSVRNLRAKAVSAPRAGDVRGGRAGGDKPVKYMEYKLKEVLISG